MSLLQQPQIRTLIPMDSLKAEKAKAMESYNNRQYRTLKNFMLLFELCLGLVMVSWLLTCVFTWIPLAVQISAAHLRLLLSSSNLFAFLFCNAVILLILCLSSLQNSHSSSPPRPDLYDEFLAASNARRRPSPNSPPPEDKHIVSENAIVASALTSVSLFDEATEKLKTEYALPPETDSVSVQPLAVKLYQRTQSDVSGTEAVERKSGKQLRRSETENGRKIVREKAARPRRAAAVEELSSEEFRLKIEAFITAQKCNQMKEHECTDIVLRD